MFSFRFKWHGTPSTIIHLATECKAASVFTFGCRGADHLPRGTRAGNRFQGDAPRDSIPSLSLSFSVKISKDKRLRLSLSLSLVIQDRTTIFPFARSATLTFSSMVFAKGSSHITILLEIARKTRIFYPLKDDPFPSFFFFFSFFLRVEIEKGKERKTKISRNNSREGKRKIGLQFQLRRNSGYWMKLSNLIFKVFYPGVPTE